MNSGLTNALASAPLRTNRVRPNRSATHTRQSVIAEGGFSSVLGGTTFTTNANGDIIMSGSRRIYATSITYLGLGGGGAVYLDGPTIVNGWAFTISPDTRTGAGAVSVATSSTALVTTGAAEAITIANGTNGQIKTISHVTDGGSAVLTPATANGFTTITFTNAGESATLQYFTTGGWIILSLRGAVAA